MTSVLKLTSVMALATTGLMTLSYLEEADVLVDTSPTSQPHFRNQYLTVNFPQFVTQLDKLPIKLEAPAKIWKVSRNEWHSHYPLGQCSKLPQDWPQALASSFGKADRWGRVQTELTQSPISVHIRTHPEFVHIFITEFNHSHFADKAWYKSWVASPSEVKSSYVMAIHCETLLHKDRTP